MTQMYAGKQVLIRKKLILIGELNKTTIRKSALARRRTSDTPAKEAPY
jgi:hypothetical protein